MPLMTETIKFNKIISRAITEQVSVGSAFILILTNSGLEKHSKEIAWTIRFQCVERRGFYSYSLFFPVLTFILPKAPESLSMGQTI